MSLHVHRCHKPCHWLLNAFLQRICKECLGKILTCHTGLDAASPYCYGCQAQVCSHTGLPCCQDGMTYAIAKGKVQDCSILAQVSVRHISACAPAALFACTGKAHVAQQ